MISRNPRKCLKFVLCTLYSSALDQPRKLKVTSKENLKSLKKNCIIIVTLELFCAVKGKFIFSNTGSIPRLENILLHFTSLGNIYTSLVSINTTNYL